VQPTQHYWHAINPALPAQYLLLRERYYAPIPYNFKCVKKAVTSLCITTRATSSGITSK
jgi:hypothetical protein